MLLEQFLEPKRNIEDEVGFAEAVVHRAGIVAAMAGIDHDASDAQAELT